MNSPKQLTHNFTRGRFALVALASLAATVTAVPLIANAASPQETPNDSPVVAMEKATAGARVSLLEARSPTSPILSPGIVNIRTKAADSGRGPKTLNNADATVRAPLARTDGSVAVVADESGTCLLLSGKYGGSYGCGPGLAKVPMLGSVDVVDAAHWRVAFLLPDGVQTFDIALQDGTTKTVPVSENIIDTIIGGGGPARFSWREANGKERSITTAAPGMPK